MISLQRSGWCFAHCGGLCGRVCRVYWPLEADIMNRYSPQLPNSVNAAWGLACTAMRPSKQYFLVIPHDQDISCRRDLLFCGSLPRICRASLLLAPAPRPRVQGFKLKIDCCIQAVAELVPNHSLIRNSGQTFHVEQSWFKAHKKATVIMGVGYFCLLILIIWNLICVYHSIYAVI